MDGIQKRRLTRAETNLDRIDEIKRKRLTGTDGMS